MDRIFLLKLDNGARIEAKAAIGLDILPGDMCVFNKSFYNDLGEVVRELDPTRVNSSADMPEIRSIAGSDDLARANENFSRSRTAMTTAHRLVESLGLPMKLINAHYSLDGKLVTIQFSADGRVDFRELVKELSRALGSRIELRQIGVRDETGIHGGIAVCGQQLCCCRFLREFSSINVKMAKEQDLSLTPSSISGICGRLKCCLAFEHQGYLEMEKDMPRKGEYCDTPSGRGRITDRNLLTRKVMVSFEGGNSATFPVAEISVVHVDRKALQAQQQQQNSQSGSQQGEKRRRTNGGNAPDNDEQPPRENQNEKRGGERRRQSKREGRGKS